MEARTERLRILLVQGDITEQRVDAVVNAANQHLQMGGGVAGALRRKGGPEIQAACDEIGGTPVGTAVITTGGRLPARHVIHAVGPRMGEGDEDAKLEGAVRRSLELAAAEGLSSIALPAISTGIFGYPLDRCARISCETALDFEAGGSSLREIRFVLFDGDSFEAFAQALRRATASRDGARLLQD